MLAVAGCYPEEPASAEDYDLVVTNHDSTYRFNTLRTYYLVDSVVHITEARKNGSSSLLDRSLDEYIINQIANEMNSRGFRRILSVSPGARPDVLLTTSALTTTNLVYYYDYWWDYWGWWGGWNVWYPNYGIGWDPWWGYPYAYGYSYTTGTLLIEMSEPNQPKFREKRFPMIWRAALNGLLTTNTANTQARVGSGIQQAFQQSPYFQLK